MAAILLKTSNIAAARAQYPHAQILRRHGASIYVFERSSDAIGHFTSSAVRLGGKQS